MAAIYKYSTGVFIILVKAAVLSVINLQRQCTATMFDRELTPPPDGRLSSSSGSPDSAYKLSTDKPRTPNYFSTATASRQRSQTSTAYKPAKPAPKFDIDEDSEYEWNTSFISPPQKMPPVIRKLPKTRSRLLDRSMDSLSVSHSQMGPEPPTPAPIRVRGKYFFLIICYSLW